MLKKLEFPSIVINIALQNALKVNFFQERKKKSYAFLSLWVRVSMCVCKRVSERESVSVGVGVYVVRKCVGENER